jgi:hypothetical protein
MLDLVVLRSMSDCDPDEWNAIDPHMGFDSRWEWLHCAETLGTTVGAVMVRGDGGRVRAAVPYWIATDREPEFRDPGRLLADVGVGSGAHLVAGTKYSFTSEVLVAGPGPEPAAMGLIVTGLRTQAAAHGVAGPIALYATGAAVDAYRAALPDPVPVLLNADAVIDVPGDLARYPLGASRRRRGVIGREWRTFCRAGYLTGVESLGDCLDEFVPLVASLERRYGHSGDEEGFRRLFGAEAAACGPLSLVFTARRDGVLRAAALGYAHGGTMVMRAYGSAADLPRGAFEYFGVSYYLPVRHAIENGRTRIRYGIESPEAKVGRGARLHPLWAVDLAARPTWSGEAARTANASRAARYGDLTFAGRPVELADWPAAGTPRA